MSSPPVEEAGSGRWLGIRYPSRRAPLSAAQLRAAKEAHLRSLRKAAKARARAERDSLRAAIASGCGAPSAPLVGLANLGNTCYISAALQCLAHARPLAAYFRAGLFASEINRDNPLGHKGQLAAAFAAMLNQMWKAKCMDAVEPRKFKLALGRFCPQFAGNHQHDAQELLSFLLDGLHEDLNRVHKKPYIALADSAGRPDAVVAREQWGAYRARDDSVIVDLYTGLLKSSLRFDRCGRVSTTFDPYTSLSLPLPKEKIKMLEITVVWQEEEEGEEQSAARASSGGGSGGHLATGGRHRRGRAPTKYCVEFDASASAALAAASAAATTTLQTSSVTAAPSASSAPSSVAAASSSSASSAASSTGELSTAPTLASLRPGLAASTRVLDVKAALGRLSGLDPSRVQLARLQLSSFDIWRRSQFNFLPNFYNISDFSLAMQSAAGHGGNKNDVYYAFQLPEPPPPSQQPTAATAHDAAATLPGMHGGIGLSFVPAAVAAVPGSAVPRFHTTPTISAASASSVTASSTAATSTAATATGVSSPPVPSYPTRYGGVSGTVTLGTKFDVKDSVHKWEVATTRDIRVLITAQAMRDLGGSLEVAVVATEADRVVADPATTSSAVLAPPVPVVASAVDTTQSTPPAAAATATAGVPAATHSLRKHSSTTEFDNGGAVRFSEENDDATANDSPESDFAPKSAVEIDGAAPAKATVAGGGDGSGDSERIHFGGAADSSDDDGEAVAPLNNGTAAVGAGAQVHADCDEAAEERSATLAPSTTVQHGRDTSLTASSLVSGQVAAPSSTSFISSTCPSQVQRFSAGPSPGLVYQHVAEIPRKLPPHHPAAELLFSFDGFSPKWNEWVPIGSSRIAPYGSGLTRTHGRNSISAAASSAAAGAVNLNAAYLTGPPPAGSQFHNPQYGGHSASSSSRGGYGYGYGAGASDAEAAWVRVHCIQRCMRSTPNLAAMTGAAKALQQPLAFPLSSSPPPEALATAASSSSSGGAGVSTPAAAAATPETPSATASDPAPFDLQLFSIPLMLWLDPRTTTTAQLYDQVWRKVRRFTRLPDALGKEDDADDSDATAAPDRAVPSEQISALEDAAAQQECAPNAQQTVPPLSEPATNPVPCSEEVAASASASDAAVATSSSASIATAVAPVTAAPSAPATASAASSAAPSARAAFASSSPSLPSYFFTPATSPFQLRYSTHSGTQCSRCQSYNKSCMGCPIDLVDGEELRREEEEEEVKKKQTLASDASSASDPPSSSAAPLLLRDTPLVRATDRPAHVRSWHNDCTLVLDWNPDYLLAGLLDAGEMSRLEVDHSVHAFRAGHDPSSDAKVDLDVCFRSFTQTEKLAGDAAVYCSGCKAHEEATKTLELYSTPPLLVLHLKRLLPDAKLFTEVRFPLRGFDPTPFLARSSDGASSGGGVEASAQSPLSTVKPPQAADGADEHKGEDRREDEEKRLPEPDEERQIDGVKIGFSADNDDQIVAHVHGLVRALNDKSAGPDTVAAAAVAVAEPPAVDASAAAAIPVPADAALSGPAAADTDASSSGDHSALRVEVTEAVGASASAAPADAAAVPATQPSRLAAPVAKRSTPSLSLGLSPPASPAATPTPTLSAPPPVYMPVGGGFDASVSGLAAQAAAGSNSPPDLYDLFAVVNHFGALGGGHYVTYAKDRERDVWFRFDDGAVSRIEESKVVSSSAYMCFYERRGLSASAGVDACPIEIREKKLNAAGRQVLRDTDATNACTPCTIQ